MRTADTVRHLERFTIDAAGTIPDDPRARLRATRFAPRPGRTTRPTG